MVALKNLFTFMVNGIEKMFSKYVKCQNDYEIVGVKLVYNIFQP
jgi:hypothetical protein